MQTHNWMYRNGLQSQVQILERNVLAFEDNCERFKREVWVYLIILGVEIVVEVVLSNILVVVVVVMVSSWK